MIANTAAYLTTTKMTSFGWIVVALSSISAACLLVGFMTPLIAVVVTLGAGTLALSGLYSSPETIVLAIAVFLLGPGAFSLDARMFGRREILLPQPHRSPKS